ncbi:hypothetical protein KW849_02190 [Pseudomonas sp. PDM26]|uniref:HEPN domain-containing protein n=1 Tax=Pseudomonas sp. PDM26 TaxID=2854766 RepID=UPI001C487DA5|nr:HEPN domain-containing protein [Pseudomonas sp. PDM26]MBV7545120.1 hypothetical protein [Pseudomonas sp. PDM26]
MLLRTRSAIDECREHLQDSNAWNTQVESYLTQYILVILCADVQQSINSLIEERISMSAATDEGLRNFAVSTGKKCLRSVGKSEVSGFLGLFGNAVKEYFNSRVDDRVVTLYNNAVSNRHDVAHNTGSTVTFRELNDIYDAAIVFLGAVSDSLKRVVAVPV